MNIRRILVSLALGGLLASGATSALASHNGEANPDFSPCREQNVSEPHNPNGETRLGYEDTEEQGDPRQELPTVYEWHDESNGSFYAGMCGGAKHHGTDQHIEVGASATGPSLYVEGKAPDADPWPTSEPQRVTVRSNVTGEPAQ